MIHRMGLYDIPFNAIKSGEKTVEVRLNDEKRRKLNIGDKIEFTVVPDQDETLLVEVKGLKEYNTFKDMYEAITAKALGAVGDSIEKMVENTFEIYTAEREKEWGTLAIFVQLV